MERFAIVSVNEFLGVNNRFGEYLIIDKLVDAIVVDGLLYEEADMELRMLNGEEISFEEYNETMGGF